MAVVSVTTDLSGGNTLTTAESITSWSETSGTGPVSGETYNYIKSYDVDTGVYIQGTGSVTAEYTTNAAERGGLLFNAGTTTVPPDGAVLVWTWWIAPATLQPFSTAGQFVAIGTGITAYDVFAVGGSNFTPNPLGGWYCFAVDPNSATPYETIGSPGATPSHFGGGIAAPKQNRGLVHFAIDAIRVGRCSSIVVGGTGADPAATFESISDVLQPTANAYGIFDSQGGSFFMQGRLALGDGTNEVRFTDQNKVVNIRNCPAVGPNFHLIEIQNGSGAVSEVNWTGCTFTNIGADNAVATNGSRGNLVVTDSTANVNVTSCAFVDMGTFSFGSDSTINDTAFRRCDTVTAVTGTTFTSSTFRETIAQTALDLSAGGTIDDCLFIGDGTSHAVNLGNVSDGGSISWNSRLGGTYAATSTTAGAAAGASEVILLNLASGTFTITVTGGDTPTYRNIGAGTVVVAESYTLTLTNIVAGSEVRIFAQSDLTEQGGGIEQIGITTPGSGWTAVAEDSPPTRYTATYTYPYSADVPVFITVVDVEYEIVRQDETLGNTSRSIKINQIFDRVYDEGGTPFVNP